MMGVYIKGMEMPASCAECRLSTVHSFKDRPLCDVLVEYMSYGEWEVKRLDNCPLVPVPPHGRLIDADAPIEVWEVKLSELCPTPRNIETTVSKFLLSHLMGEVPPTIIPAEEGE